MTASMKEQRRMLHKLTPTECMSSSSRAKHYIWDHTLDGPWAGIAQSVQAGDGIPVGSRVSAPDQTGPGGHTQPRTKWIKRPWRGVDHPHPSSAKVKERVGLNI
jgi:hypothetical protein